jgi:DNA-binding transcriptional MocR family regulator
MKPRTDRGDRFAAVPAAWEDRQRDFTPTARAVYVQLLLTMNRKNGKVRTSLRSLAALLGLSRGAVDRGVRDLVAGGVVLHTPGSNQHSDTTIEVLLRRGGVPSAGQRGVPSAGQRRASTSPKWDSASHQRDSGGTAHPLSPADSLHRGLEVFSEEEGDFAAPSGDPDGPSGATEEEHAIPDFVREYVAERFGKGARKVKA